jgi:hypothetical protein
MRRASGANLKGLHNMRLYIFLVLAFSLALFVIAPDTEQAAQAAQDAQATRMAFAMGAAQ